MFQIEAAQRKLCEELDALEAMTEEIVAVEALVNSLKDGYGEIEDRLYVMQDNSELMVNSMGHVLSNVQAMHQIVNELLNR